MGRRPVRHAHSHTHSFTRCYTLSINQPLVTHLAALMPRTIATGIKEIRHVRAHSRPFPYFFAFLPLGRTGVRSGSCSSRVSVHCAISERSRCPCAALLRETIKCGSFFIQFPITVLLDVSATIKEFQRLRNDLPRLLSSFLRHGELV